MNFTIILIILTALISYQAFNHIAFREKLLFHPYVIKEQGEWYRFLTSGFIHADWTHLIVNMYVLYQFGPIIEHYLSNTFGVAIGRVSFIVFYLSGIVIASVPSYFKHQNNPYYRALGASGATSAVVFAFILFFPWEWFLFPPMPAVLLGVVYLWYSSYMSKRGQDNIGHDAHFWGAVYGVLFILSIGFFYDQNLLDTIISRLLAGPKAPNF